MNIVLDYPGSQSLRNEIFSKVHLFPWFMHWFMIRRVLMLFDAGRSYSY